jgi:hypothetical protein
MSKSPTVNDRSTDNYCGQSFVPGQGASVVAGEKAGVDGLPSSHSFFSTGSVFMADRSGKGKVTGRSSRNYHRNTTVYSSFSPLPRKEQAEAIA